ncbi:MAG: cytochrome-c oxidase, cbb3-type subunit III [Gammaproteobacteria bacterium]|nr:cytochrome-c oxidase, cbb3-type subunit III [Gammaproteobacteria bacterium]
MSDENKFPGENNTGHIWDDNLRELLNDPPTWWRIGFHASWILVVVYTLLYPSWPLINTHFKGLMGWTSINEYKTDLQSIEDVRAPYENKLKNMTAAEILADDSLSNYVVRSAKVLFGDNCSACHGSGGQGIPNFPVLADDDWLYGGTIADIEMSITAGRQGMMPANAAMVNNEEADKLANAILAGNITTEPLYMEKGCVGCHGPDGKGIAPLGSANLTDSIYRFASANQLASIKQTILHGVNDPVDTETHNAVMPSFGGTKLNETDIKKLAVYVHKLGGGK